MVLCGHKLGKRWYFDLKMKVELYQDLIKNELKRKEENKYVLGENPIHKEDFERINKKADKIINKWQSILNEEKKNLEVFTNAIKSLPEREKKFAMLHFMEGETVEEISFRMDYSIRHVNHIKKKAIKLMEEYITTHEMPF